jgi:hypothetical protein
LFHVSSRACPLLISTINFFISQHVYTKWNERLFREMYSAYTAGRTNTDPTNGWYDGELRFFDGYVIPLAKKLKECGVFGVSSDEVSAAICCIRIDSVVTFLVCFTCDSHFLIPPSFLPTQYLNYAEKNRAEWLARGQEVVQSFSSKVARKNSMSTQEKTTKNKMSSGESKESNQTSSSDNNNNNEQSDSKSTNNKQQIADIKVTDVRVSPVKVSDMQAKLAEQLQQQSKFTESKLGETDLLDLVKKKQANMRSAAVPADGRSISSENKSTLMKSPAKKFAKKKQGRKGSLAPAPTDGSDMNFL